MKTKRQRLFKADALEQSSAPRKYNHSMLCNGRLDIPISECRWCGGSGGFLSGGFQTSKAYHAVFNVNAQANDYGDWITVVGVFHSWSPLLLDQCIGAEGELTYNNIPMRAMLTGSMINLEDCYEYGFKARITE